MTDTGNDGERVLRALSDVGIDLEDVFAVLEREGVDKFVASWEELLGSMESRLT